MIIRRKFPQIYEFEHRKNGRYWLVSARRQQWGLDERKTFLKKALAEKYAVEIETRFLTFGKRGGF